MFRQYNLTTKQNMWSLTHAMELLIHSPEHTLTESGLNLRTTIHVPRYTANTHDSHAMFIPDKTNTICSYTAIDEICIKRTEKYYSKEQTKLRRQCLTTPSRPATISKTTIVKQPSIQQAASNWLSHKSNITTRRSTIKINRTSKVNNTRNRIK